jgi:hypothetical protein
MSEGRAGSATCEVGEGKSNTLCHGRFCRGEVSSLNTLSTTGLFAAHIEQVVSAIASVRFGKSIA